VRDPEPVPGSQGRSQATDEPYRALTVLMPDLVFIVDDQMRVVMANSAAAHFAGRPLEQIKGARVAELFGPKGAQFEERLSKAAAMGRSLDFEESLGTGEDEVWMKTSLVPLADVAPGFVLGISRDVSDSRRLQIALQSGADEIEYLATHDSLTGVANRRAFIAAVRHAGALGRRGICSTVFYMDVDLFKRVNDERGHEFGDETLASVAGLLKAEVRDVDLIARIGGDEFAALLVGSTDSGAAAVAKRMTERVKALGTEIGVPIGLSIGIVAVDPDSTVDHMMSIADHRMYAHKTVHRGGREAAPKA
jgi:two-component system, cell cycle response regulator